MDNVQTSLLTLRLNKTEKEKFRLLAAIENKTISGLLKSLVENELHNRKFTASEIRKLPREQRTALLKQMTEEAMPVYNKYKEELFVDETGDGID